MSGDEAIVTVISLLVGPIGWIFWFASARSVTQFRVRRATNPSSLMGTVGLCALIILVTLRFGAADDVRDAPQYVVQYFFLGLAWIRLALWWFPFLGLHPRDDLFERQNAAAVPACCGALIGVACCYAGGNIGNGPGWWVVVFSAGLATAGLAAFWLLVGQGARLVDAVTIDRNPAAGWRLGMLLATAGFIFGLAVTGDWISASATVADFVLRSWPAAILAAIAFGLERLRALPQRSPR